MAASALEARPRHTPRFIALATTLLGVIAVTTKRLATPHKASLARLAEIPLTVLGLGCIDTGVFQASTVAGWIVTGLSLILLEHLIADEAP